LGDDPDNWREAFIQRLRLFEDSDIQAITVHPRFSTEKLKRRARWSEFPWIASQTHLPVIGNGDVRSLQDIRNNAAFFSPLSGLMLGRIAAQKPWIFAEFSGMKIEPDHQAIWERLYKYTLEDFPPERAIGRIKEFTSYFSQNYVFGHELFKGSLKARDVAQIYDAAIAFFQSNPQLAAA
jgi:tRNA-dihydrouridine synthase